MLEELKQLVYECNMELPKNGLVNWTSGNVSGRDEKRGYVVIKPSGVRYETMKAVDMAVVDLDGKQIEGKYAPSSDTASHLQVYRHRKDVNGIVHTHSNYASAFAVVGKAIPACMTMIAENFGVEIPLGDYAPIGGEAIGNEILRSIGKSPAILMKNHGVFTIGPTPIAALKSAIILEDVAKTYWLALQVGEPQLLDPEEVLHHMDWYKTSYGQK